jgi:hypothetical protein
MNIYILFLAAAVVGIAVGVIIYLVKRRPTNPLSHTTPPNPLQSPRINAKPTKLGKTPGWVSIPSGDWNVVLRLCNRSAMGSILVIQNKDGTRLRLKINLFDGSFIYSPPVATVDEINHQINLIMAA